jgi:hypothetical protein
MQMLLAALASTCTIQLAQRGEKAHTQGFQKKLSDGKGKRREEHGDGDGYVPVVVETS